ncbi:MAG: ABC transporter substrate-binding protein, partial [Humidesulfovibrio sp.]|nr:ABC transporter substrate-binding protein [Humidesulfovibrio sp.]
QVTLGRKYAFRVCLVDTVQGRLMARYAFHVLGLRSIAVLFDESDTYPQGLARYFSEAFAALGGKVVAQEGYPGGAADFSTQLGRIRAAKAQALYLPNYAQDVVLQMTQAKGAGFGGVFLGGDSWEEGTSVLELPAAQGSFFTANFAHGLIGEAARRQAERLETIAGVPLDSDGAMILDALGVILAGAKAAGSTDPVSLREGIASLRGYEGFSGRLSFERGGDAVRGAHIMAIEGGQARCRKELGAAP